MIQAKVQVSPRVRYSTKNGLNVYAWGETNNWPSEAITLVGNSGTATQCIDKIGRYLMGEGLRYDGNDAKVKSVVEYINKTVLPEVCMGFAFIPILATNPSVNGMGEITDLKPIDNTTLRSGEVDSDLNTDRWWTCGDWPNAKIVFDPKYPERLAIPFDVYQGKEGEKQRYQAHLEAGKLDDWKKLKHIIIDTFKGRGDTIYPTPTWWAGANAIYLDGQSLIFQVDNLDNNFNATIIVHIKENLDGIMESGESKRDYVKKELKSKFTGSTENGGEKDRFIMLDGIEAPIEITDIPNGATHQMYDSIYRTANDTIAKVFGIAKQLLSGEGASGIGSTKQIIDAITLLNNDLYPIQQQIARYFSSIVNNWAGVQEKVSLEIIQNMPLSELPAEVIKRMSSEQMFDMFGIKSTPNA
jgi:hypothetical protein